MGFTSSEPSRKARTSATALSQETSRDAPPRTPDASHKNRKRRSKDKSRSGAKTPKVASGHASADDLEAGPSKRPASPKNESDAFDQADFIPFDFSDPEEVEEVEPPRRESDKGWDKGKSRDDERSSRKRKVDDVDLNDGYANKKQRMNAASRRAPWAVDVDWERCNNVAEL